MKKTGIIGAAVAGLMALAGTQAVTNTAPANEDGIRAQTQRAGTNASSGQQTPAQKLPSAERGINIKCLPMGYIEPYFTHKGMTPKEWGQYLSHSGRDKRNNYRNKMHAKRQWA